MISLKKGAQLVFWMALLLCQMGFDFDRHNIPLKEIHSGGPAKDGIPALYDPVFVAGNNVQYLKSSDRILGLHINGEAKAYPIKILNWHEIVNDTIGGKEVFVSYCPLCGTGMAFDARINDKRFLFGVSGMLYNSDVLMYDKRTESLWSQIKMEAVTGPMMGTRLNLLPVVHTTWGAWLKQYSDTAVLSKDTGYLRKYEISPYKLYASSDQLMFPVSHNDNRLKRKEWVLGVIINKQAKAYSFEWLKTKGQPIEDVVGDTKIHIEYDKENRSAVIKDGEGEVIPSIQSYWFAWVAFYPKTLLNNLDAIP